MRYWYDTEFLEDGHTIAPISIGIVAEDGRELYAVVEEIGDEGSDVYKRIVRNRWLMENVIRQLPLKVDDRGEPRIKVPTNVYPQNPGFSLDLDHAAVLPRHIIAKQVRAFLLDPNEHIELWAYYGAYDHVLLMQLWGSMMKRPKGIPMWSNDVQQLADMWELEGFLPESPADAHNALADARWTKQAYDVLHRIHFDPLGLD